MSKMAVNDNGARWGFFSRIAAQLNPDLVDSYRAKDWRYKGERGALWRPLGEAMQSVFLDPAVQALADMSGESFSATRAFVLSELVGQCRKDSREDYFSEAFCADLVAPIWGVFHFWKSALEEISRIEPVSIDPSPKDERDRFSKEEWQRIIGAHERMMKMYLSSADQLIGLLSTSHLNFWIKAGNIYQRLDDADGELWLLDAASPARRFTEVAARSSGLYQLHRTLNTVMKIVVRCAYDVINQGGQIKSEYDAAPRAYQKWMNEVSRLSAEEKISRARGRYMDDNPMGAIEVLVDAPLRLIQFASEMDRYRSSVTFLRYESVGSLLFLPPSFATPLDVAPSGEAGWIAGSSGASLGNKGRRRSR